MHSLIHTPLSAPAQFVGKVDATHERTTPCPRTLEQAFGPAAIGGVIVPLPEPARPHRAADIALYVVGVIGVVAAIAFNNFQ
ncbi:hypothetical protein GmRootV59_12720 [Variovorax sp. V59]|uniref:hypothetical protein n=1 Tax=unclassified Variovorax TaxID=663243 RepID=UPI0034E8C258